MLVPMKVDYGVRLLVDLALQPAGVFVPSADIATRQHIPEAYMGHVCSDLQRAGLILSRRGPQGGHMLGRPAGAISVADVLTSFDRSLAPMDCVDEPGECTLSGACSQRELWSDVEKALLELLSQTRIGDLAEKQRVMVAAL